MKKLNGIWCQPYKLPCTKCDEINEVVWNLPYECDRCKYGNRRSSSYKIVRGDVIERDKFKCRVCSDKVIDVHHIDGDHHNNKMINLISLCRKCHGIFHRIGTKTYTNKQLKEVIIKAKEIRKKEKLKPTYFKGV